MIFLWYHTLLCDVCLDRLTYSSLWKGRIIIYFHRIISHQDTQHWQQLVLISVADPGCLSRIRICLSRMDPNFFHPGSRIRIKEFKYLTKKIVSKLSEI